MQRRIDPRLSIEGRLRMPAESHYQRRFLAHGPLTGRVSLRTLSFDMGRSQAKWARISGGRQVGDRVDVGLRGAFADEFVVQYQSAP